MYNANISQLSQFGLKKNHIKLMNFFLQNIGKELAARELSSQVRIPVSRIYVYLNDLVKFGLLDRKFHEKAMFTLTEPETRLREFLLSKDVEIKEMQKGILDSLRAVTAQGLVMVKSSEEFYQSAYSMVKDANMVKILSHNPLLIFSGDGDYWGGQLFEAYKKKIEGKELKFFYIFDKNFLKSRELTKHIEEVVDKLKWLNSFKEAELRVVDGKNILPLLTMIITDSEVLVGFSSPENMKVVRGLLLRSDEMAGFFKQIYGQIYVKSKKVDIKALNALSTSVKLFKKFSLRFKKGKQ